MKKHCRMLWLLPTFAMLVSCARPQETTALNNEVGQLHQKMQALSTQALALEQQNALNKQSTQGVYLLPAAQHAALLQSGIGTLSVSLSHIELEANGSQAVLHIAMHDGSALPTFRAQLDWGQLDNVSGRPLMGDKQTQSVTVDSTLLPKTEQDIVIRLSGLIPEQVGFVRLHQIVAGASPLSPTLPQP